MDQLQVHRYVCMYYSRSNWIFQLSRLTTHNMFCCYRQHQNKCLPHNIRWRDTFGLCASCQPEATAVIPAAQPRKVKSLLKSCGPFWSRLQWLISPSINSIQPHRVLQGKGVSTSGGWEEVSLPDYDWDRCPSPSVCPSAVTHEYRKDVLHSLWCGPLTPQQAARDICVFFGVCVSKTICKLGVERWVIASVSESLKLQPTHRTSYTLKLS